ncbi:hypothetical protein ACO2KH_10465 [Leptospira terpstrae]
MLILAPVLDPQEPSFDRVYPSCVRYSYKYSQCNNKKKNITLYDSFN